MKLFDITRTLHSGSPCWPGDTPYQLEWTASIPAGDPVNVSRITMSPHSGTHADAPFHYGQHGAAMDLVPAERWIGRARVVALEGLERIAEADLQGLDLAGVERLLLRTGSCPDAGRFHPDFAWLEPGAVRFLAAAGIRLIGTDAHSVDPFDSEALPAHHACLSCGVLILENLCLQNVPPGDYELIALPLKLAGADASPVRAVLRELP